jgi:PAS domain S-box-containing protein
MKRLSLGSPLVVLLLVLYTAVGGLYTLHRDTMRGERQVEEEVKGSVTLQLTQLQGTLEYLLQSGQLPVVRARVAGLGSNPDLQVGLLLDERGRVLASTRLALSGRPVSEAWPELARAEHVARMQWAREHMTGQVEVDTEGQRVVGYYPILLGHDPQRERVGVLVLQQDLKRLKAANRHQVEGVALRSSLLMVLIAGAMWLLFFVLGRRIQRLATAARGVVGGQPRVGEGPRDEDALGMLGQAVDDITEEIGRSRERLKENQERVQLLLDSTAEALIGLDLEGRCTFCNRAALFLLGYGRVEEVLGLPLHQLIHRSAGVGSKQEGCRVCVDFRSSEYLQGEDEVLRCADGVELPVEYRAHAVRRGGQRVGFVVTFIDISERKRVEEALRRSEASFRTLIERSPDAIVVHREGTLRFVNAATVRMLGYERAEELQGRPVEALVLHGEAVALTRYSGVDTLCEVHFRHRAGRLVMGEVVSFPLLFDGERMMVSLVRDITERKQVQEKLRAAERMASLGTLSAGMAHEVNNPIAYVQSNLGFIQEELHALVGTDEKLEGARWREVLEALRESRAGCQRVRDIVLDLKTFSRGDEESRGPVDLHAVLDSCANVARGEIRHRARLVKDYGELPQVHANESRLGQLFLNLIVNAAQAIPEADVKSHEIRISTLHEGEWVVVAVKDSGIGIPPENRARLFDPFFTTKPIGVGTGLGLSICHGIVVGMGGRIEVESEVGQGTTFRVFLPARAPSAEVPAVATGAEPDRTGREQDEAA